MILQRLYSRTHELLKNPEERSKKAAEILEKRKKFHEGFDLKKRLNQIDQKYLEDLEKAANGKPISTGKNGELKYLDVRELKGRRDNAIQNAKAYWNDFYELNTEGVSRKKIAKAKEEAKREAEKESKTIKGRLKKVGEFAKKNKKAFLIGGGTVAASGIAYGGYKAIKSKRERNANERIRKQVSGYDSSKAKKK